MDFKSLISKINSMNDPVATVKAPEQAAPIRLDEDTELRVLAGVTTLTESVIAEKAVSKAQQKFMGMVHATQKGEKAPSKDVAKVAKEMGKKDAKDFASTKHKGLPEKKTDESVEEGQEDLKKVGDKVKTSKGVMTKTATGLKHERSYEKEKDEDDDEPKAKKKAKKESIEPEFKSKFMKMVEAKKEDSAADKKKKEEKKKKIAKIVDEGSKPDFLDLDKDGNKKEPMKSAAKGKGDDKKEGGKKGMSPAQEKYFGKKNESVKTSKKVVAESVEGKLSLKDMLNIVKESGGQQAIDPMDKELWTWATRVAASKIQESQKAEIFAAMIYERNGGTFEMYDVLSENQK